MKTFNEKADIFMEASELYKVDFGKFKDDVKYALAGMLKEQDRDSRNAALEQAAAEVNKLAMDHDTVVAAVNVINLNRADLVR